MPTGIDLTNHFIFAPLLVDTTLEMKFEVIGMNAVIAKFKQQNISLLNEKFYEDINHETIKVDMLLGIDILQSISSVSWDKTLGGSCLVVDY